VGRDTDGSGGNGSRHNDSLWLSTSLAAAFAMAHTECLSCHLLLSPGVVHQSAADCNAALLTEIVALKKALAVIAKLAAAKPAARTGVPRRAA
jgi:hypothetical protein